MSTIYDVAKEVGCAPSTISKYITKHGYVSKQLGNKIEQAMVKLDYHYNGLARNLCTHTNNRIGIMVPFLDHPYFQRLVSAITEEASQAGKEVVILPTAYDDAKEEEYLHELEHNLLSSLIITSHTLPVSKIASYNRFGKIVFCEETSAPQTLFVANNRLSIFQQLLQKLKDTGLNNIGFMLIRQPRSSKTTQQLFSAFHNVFGDRSPLAIYDCRTVKNGRSGYYRLIDQEPNLQVILAESDISAAGALLASQAENNELMIIGQGNQLASKILNFTSIDQRLSDIGKKAVQMALGHDEQSTTVDFKIIWRNKGKKK